MNISAEDLQKILIIFLCLLTAGILIGGLCNKLVIYYDAADVGGSLLAVILPFIGLLLSSPEIELFDADIFNQIIRNGLGPIIILIGLIFLLKNFISSIKHNRSIMIGLLVGLYKIAFLLFSVFAIVGYFSKVTGRRSASRDILIATLLFFGFRVIAYAMINGERVYLEKGWNNEEKIAQDGNLSENFNLR